MTPLGPPWWRIFIPILMMLTPWDVQPARFTAIPDKTLTVKTWNLPGTCHHVEFYSDREEGVGQYSASALCYQDPQHVNGLTAATTIKFYGNDGYVKRLWTVAYDFQGNVIYTPSRNTVEGWWYMGAVIPAKVQGSPPYPVP